MAEVPCSGQWFRTRCPHWLLPAGWVGATCLKGPQSRTFKRKPRNALSRSADPFSFYMQKAKLPRVTTSTLPKESF